MLGAASASRRFGGVLMLLLLLLTACSPDNGSSDSDAESSVPVSPREIVPPWHYLETDPAPDDGVFPARLISINVEAGTVVADRVQIFYGAEAESAATSDGLGPSDRDVYVRDLVSEPTTLPLDVAATASTSASVHGSSAEAIAEIADLLRDDASPLGERLRTQAWLLRLTDGVVAEIVEKELL